MTPAELQAKHYTVDTLPSWVDADQGTHKALRHFLYSHEPTSAIQAYKFRKELVDALNEIHEELKQS